jgi:hypothetical protein
VNPTGDASGKFDFGYKFLPATLSLSEKRRVGKEGFSKPAKEYVEVFIRCK